MLETSKGRHDLLVRQLVSFVKIGLAATSVHYLVLVGTVQLLHTSPVPSALLGYCCGGVLSYALNRRLTFQSDRPHGEAVWRFALVAGVGFVVTFLCMALLVDRLHVPYLLAQVATTGLVMVWTFAANRLWTFAQDAPEDTPADRPVAHNPVADSPLADSPLADKPITDELEGAPV